MAQYHVSISAKHKWLELNLKEVWNYRDLIYLFTKRNFVVSYKQTLYCYVLAKDGAEGYINQRYVFVRSRKPGEEFVNDTQCWAKLQGTDVMTGKVFDKLTSKNKKKKK